jgi:hypothetical protein
VIYEKIICEVGMVDTILSDRGKELIAKGVQEMCKQFGIRKVETGGYNARANGCIERFHRWLGAALSILKNRTSGDWESFVQPVIFAYRSSTNDATGFTPFELNHGRLPQLPYDAIFSHDQIQEENPAVYYSKLVQELKRTFALAREAQLNTATRNEERVEGKKFKPDFSPGDEVFIWKKSAKESKLCEDDREAGRDRPNGRHKDGATRRRTVPTKLQYRWHDPSTVVRLEGDMYCVVKREGVETRIHVNRLTRKYHWTEAMPDTAIWDWLPVAKPSEPKTANQGARDKGPIAEGETIIFPNDLEDGSKIPFGIGIVTDASDQCNIQFQWLGNAKGRANVTFRLCWHQMRTSELYYAAHKLHANHTPGTGSNVDAKEVIAHGTDVLNVEGKISTKIRHILEDNPTIIKA